jgi:integrase
MAITLEQHQRIVERETNPERRAYYQLSWFLGGANSDMACLRAENIDWSQQMVSFIRRKTQSPCLQKFGPECGEVLRGLPRRGPLFPYLCTVRESDRATEFRQRCQGLGIEGVTLHSYRYSWAERAAQAGMPERYAQAALGHGSRAVHRAYAKQAVVMTPCLEELTTLRNQRPPEPSIGDGFSSSLGA